MGATSKNYGDIMLWIGKVIDSIEHPQQELVAMRLILLFERKIKREQPNWNASQIHQYTSNLDVQLQYKKYKNTNDAKD